jgi:hypothetical protein
MNARIQRLRAEVASDARAFDARVEEIAALPPLAGSARSTLAQAAVALHHAYGAVEAALMRVARALEEGVPEGPDWHQALLASMALDIQGVRPAVISAETLAHLQRLLGFRHFFRHSYAADWDAQRLEDLRVVAIAARPLVADDLRTLDRLLGELG